MKIKHYIYGLATAMMLMLLSGCNERDSIFDSIEDDDPSIIHIGGIQNSGVETALGGYTSRAGGDDNGANAPVDAETVEWLLGPLFGGLDITYGKKNVPSTNRVAILKLLKQNPEGGNTKDNIKFSAYKDADGKDIAEYSFKYRTGTSVEGEDAKWYDNGFHTFQGVFVPEHLRYKANETAEKVNGTSGTAPNLKVDQSKDDKTKGASEPDANYTLLERYLGMPADANIQATVGRIKLPFRHRLARVIAYILIDPTMGNVKIDGYNYSEVEDPETHEKTITPDDASTSKIRFCNVDVLAGVEEKEGSDEEKGHATLTPIWDTSRKVIPHFVEESVSKNSKGEVVDPDNFIMFYDTEYKAYIFPTNDKEWAEAYDNWNTAYEKALNGNTNPTSDEIRAATVATERATNLKRTVYGKVPVYDLIVRPTYTLGEMVMYDENLGTYTKEQFAEATNNIDFEITLDNSLEYSKQFTFDLNANHQNIVYLRINRESIDYNTSGADVWDEDKKDDGYYGVNNQNGNTLSFAGSSWQRAYRIGSKTDNVTDGHWYGKDDPNDDDNVQNDDAMPWYPQYVDQTKWIQMFAEAYMDPTTNKKGLHHGDYFILDQDITIDARQLPDNFVFTGHLDGQDHTITLTNGGKDWYEDHYTYDASTNYGASTLYELKNEEYVEFHLPELYTHTPAVLYTPETAAEENANHQIQDSEGRQPGEDGYTPTYPNDYTPVSAGQVQTSEHYDLAHPTLAQVMEGTTTYYTKDGDVYTAYSAPTVYEYVNHPIHHTSGSTLFAGLNGAYAAAIGEANVHSETQNDHTVLVPYVDSQTKTGWRAEVINTKISGADMFPSDAIKSDGNYDTQKVSGYVYNCWKVEGGKTAIKSHTPALPQYK